jgi:hypothetical protein
MSKYDSKDYSIRSPYKINLWQAKLKVSALYLDWLRRYFGPVHPAYNPYFSACFFSRNSIFLSQQISQRYFQPAYQLSWTVFYPSFATGTTSWDAQRTPMVPHRTCLREWPLGSPMSTLCRVSSAPASRAHLFWAWAGIHTFIRFASCMDARQELKFIQFPACSSLRGDLMIYSSFYQL